MVEEEGEVAPVVSPNTSAKKLKGRQTDRQQRNGEAGRGRRSDLLAGWGRAGGGLNLGGIQARTHTKESQDICQRVATDPEN